MFKLFDFSLKASGFPLGKAQAELHKISSIQEFDFRSYVESKKTEIVNFHLQHNVAYQKLVGSNTYSNWSELPVMKKADLQNPLSDRLSNGFVQTNCYINKTSGSSGDPFIFAKDKFAHALTWAMIIDRFGWYGIDFNLSYQARFYGIPLNFLANKKERLKDFLSSRYRFSIFDLSDRLLESVLKKFKSAKFDYINGYASPIVLFAKFLLQKNIILKEACPSLKVCFTTSEMLFDSDRLLLEQQFGVPIINEYGASELDLIAFQNPNGEWQVNSETLFVEILDDQDKVLPYGQSGRVVITSLYNKAHPFIRYDIGDIGVLAINSTPKKPILQSLIGRTNDVALLPSGKKAAGLTFYYVTKSIIEDDGNVKEFVIKQTKLDCFEIVYVSHFELDSQKIEKTENAISLYLEKGLFFTFTRKEKLERSNRGKLKQFESLL